MTYHVYHLATSPFKNWVSLGWDATFAPIAMMVGVNAAVGFLARGRSTHA
ncbi:MAG: hypothetical protein ACLQEQ_05905 [Nitrososphaerales archaeon]